MEQIINKVKSKAVQAKDFVKEHPVETGAVVGQLLICGLWYRVGVLRAQKHIKLDRIALLTHDETGHQVMLVTAKNGGEAIFSVKGLKGSLIE